MNPSFKAFYTFSLIRVERRVSGLIRLDALSLHTNHTACFAGQHFFPVLVAAEPP
jgi:hypothetical protein